MAPLLDSVMPDMVITNGNIMTVDKDFTIAKAVAIKDHKIVYVGNDEDIGELIGDVTQVLDLKGNAMLPGINDAHSHLKIFGLSKPPFMFDLSFPAVRSINEIAEMIGERVKDVSKGEWIEGWGWNEGYLDECLKTPGRDVTRHDLDAVSPDNPVCLTRFCGHVVWVNTKALELANVTNTTCDPQGGKIVREESTGKPIAQNS